MKDRNKFRNVEVEKAHEPPQFNLIKPYLKISFYLQKREAYVRNNDTSVPFKMISYYAKHPLLSNFMQFCSKDSFYCLSIILSLIRYNAKLNWGTSKSYRRYVLRNFRIRFTPVRHSSIYSVPFCNRFSFCQSFLKSHASPENVSVFSLSMCHLRTTFRVN